jgi:hypothetical protein
MSQLCNASHLQTMGASPEQAKRLAAFALPTSFIDFLKTFGDVPWGGLISWCEKWGPVVPAFFVAFEGGGATLLAFAIKEAADVPTMIAELRALFATPAA